jgi:hypothetical protein
MFKMLFSKMVTTENHITQVIVLPGNPVGRAGWRGGRISSSSYTIQLQAAIIGGHPIAEGGGREPSTCAPLTF